MKRARPPGVDPDDEPTQPMPRLAFGSSPSLPRPRPATQPDPSGFGDYLVAIGVLTQDRLRAAQAYQRSTHVQLSTAVVTLGLASVERIELAAVAFQAERSRQH